MIRDVAASSLGEIRFGRGECQDSEGPSAPSFRPLPVRAYRDPEVFAQEASAVFRASWQIVCHVSDIADPGAYLVFELLDDSVAVVRGRDGAIRGFVNACRHRGARLLDGRGACPARLTCPYHGWSYGLDGALKTVPFEEGFPGLDRARHGLLPVDVEVLHGFVFVRLSGDGPSVAELWGEMSADLATYRLTDVVALAPVQTEVWGCNWKVAIDNYLESYHVPIGHPGLNRLLGPSQELDVLASGVTRGICRLRGAEVLDGEAGVSWSERRYRSLLDRVRADGELDHLSDAMRGEWRFYSMLPNLGLDIYPDVIDFFQVLPLDIGRCAIRYGIYGLPSESRKMAAVRQLNDRINRQVNAEDKVLCERVQKGLLNSGYEPGPMAAAEICVAQLHDHVRDRVAVLEG